MRMRWGAASGAASAEPKASRNHVPAASVSLAMCINGTPLCVDCRPRVRGGDRGSLLQGLRDLHPHCYALSRGTNPRVTSEVSLLIGANATVGDGSSDQSRDGCRRLLR